VLNEDLSAKFVQTMPSEFPSPALTYSQQNEEISWTTELQTQKKKAGSNRSKLL